jgi:multiple sugar transport system substrate-binding protein
MRSNATRTSGWLAALALTAGAVFIAPAAAAAKTKLKFMIWTYEPELVQGFVRAFEAQNPDVEVEVEGVTSAQYIAKMTLLLQSKTPADVAYVRDNSLSLWVDKGWIRPIDECPGVAEEKQNLLPLALQAQSYKGKLYGLTYYSAYYPLIFDERMMKEAGFDHPPRSYDEWIEQAKTVKAKGIAEYPVLWPIKPAAWGAMFVLANMVLSRGGTVLDENLKFTPAAVETLRWQKRLFDEKLVDPSSIEWGPVESAQAYMEGKTYTMINQHLFAGPQWANNQSKSKIAGEVRLAPLPGNGKSLANTAMYGIVAHTAHFEEACRLVYFLGAKDRNGQYLTPKSWVEKGALTWGAKGLEKDPAIRAYFESWKVSADDVARNLETAQHFTAVLPYNAQWYQEWQEWADHKLQDVYAGKIGVEAAVKEMEQRALQLSKRY